MVRKGSKSPGFIDPGKVLKLLLPALIVTCVTFGMVLNSQAAVTLMYFRAEGQDGQVELSWETASEIDNLGYYVLRSLNQTSGFIQISDFIPTEGDGFTGAVYEYIDTDVENGTSYWYKLESIDYSQNVEIYEPAVLAIPGVILTPTPTATRTALATSGSTATATSQAATATPTRTATNAYPGPATATSANFNTVTPGAGTSSSADLTTTPGAGTEPGEGGTPAAGATATLVPLPVLALQFPDAPVNTVLATPIDEITQREPPVSGLAWFTPGRTLPIALILLIWMGLAGWYYTALRRVE